MCEVCKITLVLALVYIEKETCQNIYLYSDDH